MAGLASAADCRAAEPEINLWYGDELQFGVLGTPHPRISILGAFSPPERVESASYALNGGVAKPLSLGPDGYRLSRPGAFKAEVDRSELRVGASEVAMFARGVGGGPALGRKIRVNYVADRRWLPPYSIH
jgi:hypothetical protein